MWAVSDGREMSMYYYTARDWQIWIKGGGGGGGLIFANNQYATDILCIAKSIVTGSCVLAVPSALAWHYFPAVRVISHIYMSKDGMLQIPLF